MSDYDEIYHTETNDLDEMDLAAHEEAHKILSGEIPSSPKTYAMVLKFYGNGKDTQKLEQATQPTLAKQGRDRNVRSVDARLLENLRAESGTLQRP